MTSATLLRVLGEALAAAGVPHMLTGSMAAAWHGAGRATMDVDLVIDPTASQLESLLLALDRPGLYVAPEAAREAFTARTMFNVVDVETGWKADLILKKHRPFSEAEFDRRVSASLDGVALSVATPEDLIIAKLEWAQMGGSTRQIEDAAALLRTTGTTLARDHVEQWIDRMGLDAEWQAARRLADEPDRNSRVDRPETT
jgi:hypothetical protein